jgi:hypothetical protein
VRLRDARLDRPLVAALTLLERFTLPRGEGEGEGEIASLRMERPLMLSARGVRRRSATAALAAGDASRPAFSAPALSAVALAAAAASAAAAEAGDDVAPGGSHDVSPVATLP